MIFNILSKVDLAKDHNDCDQLCNNLPFDCEGAFRRVWLGDHYVVKREKGEYSHIQCNRTEYELYCKYRKLNILAEVQWVTEDWKYLKIKKCKTGDEVYYMLENKLRNLGLWDDTFNDNSLTLGERVQVEVDRFCTALMILSEVGLDSCYWWDNKKFKIEYVFDILKKDEWCRRLLELPASTLMDAHVNNWGINERGELVLIDYAGV
jgi:hypothetical protein